MNSTEKRDVCLGGKVWNSLRHRDDATEDEKEHLIENARNSPPMSPMYALLHPATLVEAHKQFKRFEGKTWAKPHLVWVFLVPASTLLIIGFIREALTSGRTSGDVIVVEVAVYLVLPVAIVFGHLVSTLVRLGETCVWCRVIQRDSDGSIVAVLLTMTYRMPLVAAYGEPPWSEGTTTYIRSTPLDVLLETYSDVSQLKFSDLYDENSCWLRPPTAIPPMAERYVVGRVDVHSGDTLIRRKGGPGTGTRLQSWHVILPAGIGLATQIVAAVIRFSTP